MSSNQKKSLVELIDFYNSEEVQTNEERKGQTLPLIFTHQEIKSALKNQSQVIKKIFTHENLRLLIGYLKAENKDHAELLKHVKFDPTGESVPICLKLPFMAMEILSCECQIISELLFQGSEGKQPLLPLLLSFLDQPQHYHLASYFSRVISAITKRVSSASHKFNSYFSDWIFGNPNAQSSSQTQSYLYKSINHLYSLTTIQYITKWLLISSKVKYQKYNDEQAIQTTKIQFRKVFKLRFLSYLVEKLNSNGLDQDILNNIPSLFEQLLTQTEKSNKIATSLMIKSLPQISTGPKVTLYDLATNEDIVSLIFRPTEENCLNLAKIKLIKVYLTRYTNELQLLQKSSEDQGDKVLRIIQVIGFDELTHVVDWMFDQLKVILNIRTINTSNETSASVQKDEIEESRVRLTSSEKMVILHLLEVLRIIHTLDSYHPQLVEYYNINSKDLVRLINRLMSLENNLLQLQTSKLVLLMLRPKNRKEGLFGIPCEFAIKLLTNAITQLIQLKSAQCHVIQWADIVLSQEAQHIFENYEEEFQWDHIRETVQEMKRIHVGEYRMVQDNIDCFYSEEKALLKYSNFLTDFKVEIVYQERKEVKEIGQSEKKTQRADSTNEDIQDDLILPETHDKKHENIKEAHLVDQFSSDPSLMDIFRDNYLQYDVNSLIDEL